MNTKQTILFGIFALLGGIIGGILSDGLPRVAVAKSDVEKVIRAEKFELVDTNGNVRAFLVHEYGDTNFVIGRKGIDSYLSLHQNPQNVSLWLNHKNSNGVVAFANESRVQLGLFGKYISQNPKPDQIQFIPPTVEIEILSDGNPTLQIRDVNRKLRLALGKTELKNKKTGSTENRSTGSIVVFDEEGNVVYSVP